MLGTLAIRVMPARSLTGSKSRLRLMTGVAACAADTTSMVYPSAGACSNALMATIPPAPGLFSTMTGWLNDFDSFSATARARASDGLPAEKPTRILIGRLGKAWASAMPGATARPSPARVICRRARQVSGVSGIVRLQSVGSVLTTRPSGRWCNLDEVVLADLNEEIACLAALRATEPVARSGWEHARLPRLQDEVPGTGRACSRICSLYPDRPLESVAAILDLRMLVPGNLLAVRNRKLPHPRIARSCDLGDGLHE